jgi:hypothetical protein
MQGLGCFGVVVALGAALLACGPTTVRVATNDTYRAFRELLAVDCRLYEQRRRALSAGFDVAALFAGSSPTATADLAAVTARRWDELVQRILTRQAELCRQFNTAAVTLDVYEQRRHELEELELAARRIRDDGVAALQARGGGGAQLPWQARVGGQDVAQVAAAIAAWHQRVAP